MANAATTKPRASRKPAEAQTEEFQVFDALPKRQYNLRDREAKHQKFFEEVVRRNEGLSGDERKWLAFPRPSKGASAAVKKGSYRASRIASFEAVNRTDAEGNLMVLVTVADKA